MDDVVNIGRISPRHAADFKVRGDYVTIEQYDDYAGDTDTISLHVDSLDEAIAHLLEAKEVVRKARAAAKAKS